MIHRLMKTERPAANGGVGRVRNKCITRGSANALTNPVSRAGCQEMPWCGGDSACWSGERGQRIAKNDEPFAVADAIRPGARKESQQTRNRIRDTLHEAQLKPIAAQNLHEKAGHQRKDHFAGDVVQQTCQTEQLDVYRQSRSRWSTRRVLFHMRSRRRDES